MHPEKTLQACLKPLKEAVPLSPFFDESILSLGMISQNDHLLAAVVRKEENRSIKLYESQDSIQWNSIMKVDGDYALESCRLFMFNKRVHMILKGEGTLCCIYRLEGKTLTLQAQLHDFLPEISEPSVLVTDKDSYHLYGPCSPRRIFVPHGGHGCLFRDTVDHIPYLIYIIADQLRYQSCGYNGDNWSNIEKTPEIIQDWMRIYYAMTANLDWNVARLLEGIKEAGLEEDTIVVFTSDHGEMFGAQGRMKKKYLL